jgi:chorismate mutase
MSLRLKELRMEIDEVDKQILRLLAERVRICEAIGTVKKSLGLPVKDSVREKEVHKQVRSLALDLGLKPVQVEVVFHEIVNMCSSVQE